MAELKRIPVAGVADALEKALRYRLLNEPQEAASICRDILAVDPHNQSAQVTLLLALTDQFDTTFTDALDAANAALSQIDGDYEKAYYEGIIHERWANAQHARGMPPEFVSDWIRNAMCCYETAEKVSPADNPDAILRWNTCARFLQQGNVSLEKF